MPKDFGSDRRGPFVEFSWIEGLVGDRGAVTWMIEHFGMSGITKRGGIMSAVGRGIVLRQLDRLFGEGTLTGMGDGQLLERYLTRRDEDAFEALVDLHGPMVLGLCRRMLRDPRDIEDAFQATFLVLVRKAPAIRDRSLLSSWLYGVAFRVARRARTRTLRRRDREASVGELEFSAEPDSTARPDFDPTLDQELSRLPEKYRAPLVLCYLRGKTHDQAAAELRCPVGTVRSRLARGRDLLRKRLTRRGFAPTAMAAVLGGDATLPARLLVANRPAAAGRRDRAGGPRVWLVQDAQGRRSASLALAHGVLTTMKLAQLKWIGLAALATSLSAGSVVAVAYAAAQSQEADDDGESSLAPADGPATGQSDRRPKSGSRPWKTRSTGSLTRLGAPSAPSAAARRESTPNPGSGGGETGRPERPRPVDPIGTRPGDIHESDR